MARSCRAAHPLDVRQDMPGRSTGRESGVRGHPTKSKAHARFAPTICVAFLVCCLAGCDGSSEPPLETALPENVASRVVVPDMRGARAEEAIRQLDALGLHARFAEPAQSSEPSVCPEARWRLTVSRTEPPVGSQLSEGARIQVVPDYSRPATDWPGAGHADRSKAHGVEPCFECHEPEYCDECHSSLGAALEATASP
jgi:hypothetical protein